MGVRRTLSYVDRSFAAGGGSRSRQISAKSHAVEDLRVEKCHRGKNREVVSGLEGKKRRTRGIPISTREPWVAFRLDVNGDDTIEQPVELRQGLKSQHDNTNC